MLGVMHLLTRRAFPVAFEWRRLAHLVVVVGGLAAAGELALPTSGVVGFISRAAGVAAIPRCCWPPALPTAPSCAGAGCSWAACARRRPTRRRRGSAGREPPRRQRGDAVRRGAGPRPTRRWPRCARWTPARTTS